MLLSYYLMNIDKKAYVEVIIAFEKCFSSEFVDEKKS